MHDPRQARVESVRALSSRVHEITLGVVGPPVSFKPGQWLSLSVPLAERELTRAYWLAEPESPDGHLKICFERTLGPASRYLAGLGAGATVTFSGPHG